MEQGCLCIRGEAHLLVLGAGRYAEIADRTRVASRKRRGQMYASRDRRGVPASRDYTSASKILAMDGCTRTALARAWSLPGSPASRTCG